MSNLPRHGVWEEVYVGTGPYVGGAYHTLCKCCYKDAPNHKPDCEYAALRERLEATEKALSACRPVGMEFCPWCWSMPPHKVGCPIAAMGNTTNTADDPALASQPPDTQSGADADLRDAE